MSKNFENFQNNQFKSNNIINNVENGKENLTEEKPKKKKEEKNNSICQKRVLRNSNEVTQNELKEENLSSKNKIKNLNKNIEEVEIENYGQNILEDNNIFYENDDNNSTISNLYLEINNFRENDENSSSEKLNELNCINLLKISANNSNFNNNNYNNYNDNNQTNHLVISINEYITNNSKKKETNFLSYESKLYN